MQEASCYTYTHTHTQNFTMSGSHFQILSTRRVTQAISIQRTHKYYASPTKFGLHGDQAQGFCVLLCIIVCYCQDANIHITSQLHNSTSFRFQLRMQ